MKNIFKYCLLSLLTVLSFNSCEDSDNTIDQVFDGTQRGAILRTIQVISGTLNSSDPSSAWSVEVEGQTPNNGADIASVDVLVSINDLTPDNGTTSITPVVVKTIDGSAFSDGPNGLPRTTISATFGEAEAAMGFDSDDHDPGDQFVFDLRMTLTDGSVWDVGSTTGIVTGGFLSSPFQYRALIVCSPQPGTYRIEMQDSYGDGWQTTTGGGGPGITIDLDGTSTIEFGMCSPYGGTSFLTTGACNPSGDGGSTATAFIEIPVGTVQANWNFPGDFWGEMSFQIYGPGDELLLDAGPSTAPGILPVTLCLE